MSEVRIYIVQALNGDAVLVKATNQAQALRHIARSIYTVRAASALEVAEEMEAGQKIEDATGPQKELPMEDD
jgi:hypothetical protein